VNETRLDTACFGYHFPFNIMVLLHSKARFMLRRVLICLIVAIAALTAADAASARQRRQIDATPFRRPAACWMDGLAPYFAACSIIMHSEIDYPINENLQVTVKACRRGTTPQNTKPTTISTPSATCLRRCAHAGPSPGDSAREGMQMSVLFSFGRSGAMAAPRMTSPPQVFRGYPRHLSEGDQRVA
jgi:hypothetical protein